MSLIINIFSEKKLIKKILGRHNDMGWLAGCLLAWEGPTNSNPKKTFN